jgi:hypothetical protein
MVNLKNLRIHEGKGNWRRRIFAISSTASESQVAASPIEIGKCKKWGATTTFSA